MQMPPVTLVYDLSRLPQAGADIEFVANDEQRSRLATWAQIDRVASFSAKIALRKRSPSRFEYEAALNADIVQTCVVTLQPVPSKLELNISRALHLMKSVGKARFAEPDIAPNSDDAPEEIQDSRYDLAGPLLEEFFLAIDPYPRAAGVIFEAPPEVGAPESPFAKLRPLKSGD